MDIFKKDIHLLFIQLQIGYGIPYIYLINFTSYKKTRYFPVSPPPRKIGAIAVSDPPIFFAAKAIALRIPLKTIARVYTHFTARSHNRRYCYDSPNNYTI